MGNPFNKLTNISQMAADAGRRAMQYQGRTRLGNEDRADWRAQQRAQQERGFEFKPYTTPQRAGEVPISIRYGAGQAKPAAKTPQPAQVPRERWVRSYAAQQQGPRPDGQTPGMPPFVGPYAGNSQPIPAFLDPRTKRYTPGSAAEYETWLNGSAFGAGASPEMPRFSGLTPTDLEMANARRAQQGLPPLSESVLQSVNQADTAQRAAWQNAMDIPDAVSRAATRNTATTLGGIGRSIADAAENVYGALAANVNRYRDPYAAIERIRLNRGAPRDNLTPAAAMPAYQGDGYGGSGGYGGYGGGGGGGGGYEPTTRKWLNNMASWRI